MSDVKVWDAPRIGRYEGMQLEEAAYQRVVLASDYEALLAEVERLSQENAELRRKLDRATGLAGMA